MLNWKDWKKIPRKAFSLWNTDSALATDLWPDWHIEAMGCLPPCIPSTPRPSLIIHLFYLLRQLCHLLIIWLQALAPGSQTDESENEMSPYASRERICVQNLSKSSKGKKRDVVIHDIWGHKIISLTIKMIIPLSLCVISNVKPCLHIFRCGPSSWFMQSYWL